MNVLMNTQVFVHAIEFDADHALEIVRARKREGAPIPRCSFGVPLSTESEEELAENCENLPS